MAIIKCKMCGGNLELTEGSSLAECEYCGTRQTVPAADNEKKLTLFARANRLRSGCEFDKAAGIYETIVADFPEEAEAYWGLVLCRYGIEYVDDPATGRKIPTCHRSSFDSVLKDEDFEQVMENADPLARRVYREEAKQIEELRRGIISVSANEQPYDIFICYKETDENGDRTLDSVLAQDVYDALTAKGYRVFFSRISLADKLGMEYEPYIFAALESARIMLAFGTDYEYYNAVWVKNEWSRYLALMTAGKPKTLIPCFKNLDAYDMPNEFARLQAQDMGKVGAMQDLLRGIDNIMGRGNNPEAAPAAPSASGGSATVESLLRRAFLFLEDGDWSSANTYCERVLDIDPECARAYLGKLLAEQRVRTANDLRNCPQPSFTESGSYQKILRFGDEALRDTMVGYVTHIKDTIYDDAAAQMERAETEAQYRAAAGRFAQIPGYRDAAALREKCLAEAEEIVEAPKRTIYQDAVAQMERAETEAQYNAAANLFAKISGYRDADALRQKCLEEIEEARELCCRLLISLEEVRKNAIYSNALKKLKQAREAEQYEEVADCLCQIPDYRDAAEVAKKSLELAQKAREHRERERCETQIAQARAHDVNFSIAAGNSHVVGLKVYGTVVAVGNNLHGQCNVALWTDIEQVAAGDNHTVGLKADGTVVAIGDNRQGQCNVSGWHDIVSVAAGGNRTVGLRKDCTVVAVGDNSYASCAVSNWRDIVAVAAGGRCTVGLKANGTVVATDYTGDIRDWQDIVAVAAGNHNVGIVGLRADGRVISTNSQMQKKLSAWRQIIGISAGENVVFGLRADGMVYTSGRGTPHSAVWTDMRSIAAGESLAMGLRYSGKVAIEGGSVGMGIFKMKELVVPSEAFKRCRERLKTALNKEAVGLKIKIEALERQMVPYETICRENRGKLFGAAAERRRVAQDELDKLNAACRILESQLSQCKLYSLGTL